MYCWRIGWGHGNTCHISHWRGPCIKSGVCFAWYFSNVEGKHKPKFLCPSRERKIMITIYHKYFWTLLSYSCFNIFSLCFNLEWILSAPFHNILHEVHVHLMASWGPYLSVYIMASYRKSSNDILPLDCLWRTLITAYGFVQWTSCIIRRGQVPFNVATPVWVNVSSNWYFWINGIKWMPIYFITVLYLMNHYQWYFPNIFMHLKLYLGYPSSGSQICNNLATIGCNV